MRSRSASSTASSQEDALFLKAVRAIPGPLLVSLTDGELLDSCMLLSYPLFDPKLLGLDGTFLNVDDGNGGHALLKSLQKLEAWPEDKHVLAHHRFSTLGPLCVLNLG